MPLLNKLEVENFLCFRKKIIFPLSQATYVVGVNNAGKTAILSAIRFFFDDSIFADDSFLNKAQLTRKQEGATRSIISIEFDLMALGENSKLRARLRKKYGMKVLIAKYINFRRSRDSKNLEVRYSCGSGSAIAYEELHEDIRKLLGSIHINYLHPQEGRDLMRNAQEKLRNRLLRNWGRHHSLAGQLKELQTQWDALRKMANQSLSSSLTEELQDIWPGSHTTVHLPNNIQEIIHISNINFQGDEDLPEVQLTSQGTGAQSLILYLTHALLDSDRTLHTGLYHPVWLLEEPESFMHADLLVKLARKFTSPEWLKNIQMVVSTHSPVVLASSRTGKDVVRWNVMENHEVQKSDLVQEVSDDYIQEIGKMMGDSNFFAYFLASNNKNLIFIEDEHPVTERKFIESGIEVTKALAGNTELKKFLSVFDTMNFVVQKEAYFIIDADRGKKEFQRYIEPKNLTEEINGFRKFKIQKNIFLILLPEGEAVESLFDEYLAFVSECVEDICDFTNGQKSFRERTPHYLSHSVSVIRGKFGSIRSKQDMIELLKNEQDIKAAFWKRVEEEDMGFNQEKVNVLKALIN